MFPNERDFPHLIFMNSDYQIDPSGKQFLPRFHCPFPPFKVPGFLF
jgi:hypothetical protein